jgi:succinyl-CoA synthetase beta subunit
MNIHEYQAKELLAKFGVPVPAGHAAMSVDEAVAAAGKLPGPLYVVKAQIHAGGRGKGKFKELGAGRQGRRSPRPDAGRGARRREEMLGNTLVTIQTGAEGKQVNRLYVTDGVDIAKEFYLALLVDRAPAASRWSPRPKAAWTSRRWRTTRRRRSRRSPSIPPPA